MPTKISIRVALPQERDTLEALQRRASLANPGDREALLAHHDAIHLPPSQLESGLVFAAEDGQVIVGFAAIVQRPDGDTELDGLFVDPTRWRQGIGRQLLTRCLEAARSLKSRAMHVIGNTHARHFYGASGFDVVGTAETRFGEGILYRRALD
jgi:GNAT superfamily N-acetyltransferase